ncbi:MAG TPA: tetraacyldisaccharide 4'-kinase, partial [Candidatus Omnitrophota bacterium]|nr:tetraacyldisaccharide 4'-kinase [Candidatus Omnitrophota bacterium]
MAMIAEYFQDLALDRRRGCFSLVLKGLLWLLSLLYWLIIAVVSRIRSVRPVSVSSKVISVGNITWGGTGKTPLVELLGKMLVEDGRKVAVLTRG